MIRPRIGRKLKRKLDLATYKPFLEWTPVEVIRNAERGETVNTLQVNVKIGRMMDLASRWIFFIFDQDSDITTFDN